MDSSRTSKMIAIVEANTDDSIAGAKVLFQEYAESLGFNLCFQNFDQEMEFKLKSC